jgi:predicted sugar kinase
MPSSDLELRAADERRRLHSSVTELKSRVRETLDVKRNIRKHVALGSGIVALLSLIVGYGIAGVFTRR